MKRLVMILVIFFSSGVTMNLFSGEMEKYYLPQDNENLPRWYIPPEEGPLAGSQNFWFVTPHDVLPGRFSMSGKILQADASQVLYRLNSIWGHYEYRITPLDASAAKAPEEENELHDRQLISSRDLLFRQIEEVTERSLLFNGTVTKILPESKGFLAEVTFAHGEVPMKFEVVKIEKEKRIPQVHSRHYGPHWQHTFDIYYPEPRPEKPLPVLMNIHGGGWGALDKGGFQADSWNEAGIAVISINYRFVSNADEHPPVSPPVAAPLLDAARAIQYLRYHQKELGLDMDRLCLTGGSAGGASDCWLALHDDLAEPESDDPIARMSTRVTCITPMQAQTSLDPKQMRQWIPSIHYGAHAFFSEYPKDVDRKDKEAVFEYWLSKREEILPWIREFSPYEHASSDDPPVLHVYGGRKNTLPAEDAGHATHHPKFGEMLHKKLRELGVESHFWADDVKAENPRYHGWPGVSMFVKDKLLGPDWEEKSSPKP